MAGADGKSGGDSTPPTGGAGPSLPPHPTPKESSPPNSPGGSTATSPPTKIEHLPSPSVSAPPTFDSILPPHPTPADPVIDQTPSTSSKKRGRPGGSSSIRALLQDVPPAAPQPPVQPPGPLTATTAAGAPGINEDRDQELITPLQDVKKKKGAIEINVAVSSPTSSAPAALQTDNNTPPGPPPLSPSGQLLLRNRKDKKGNVKWYYSSAGASSSKKWAHYPPAQPQPPVYGPELPYTCKLCGMGFMKVRGLCGHMKAHPTRNWRGAFPPPENICIRGIETALAVAMAVAPPGSGAGSSSGRVREEGVHVEEEEEKPPLEPELPAAEAAIPPLEGQSSGRTHEPEQARLNTIPDLNGPPPPDSDEDENRRVL